MIEQAQRLCRNECSIGQSSQQISSTVNANTTKAPASQNTKDKTQTAKQRLEQAKEDAEERKNYEDWPNPPAPPPVPEALTLLLTDDVVWLFPKAQFHHMLTAGLVRHTMSMWGVPVPKDIQAAEHSMAVLLKLPPEPTEQHTMQPAAEAAASCTKQQPATPAVSGTAPASAGPATARGHQQQHLQQQCQQEQQPQPQKPQQQKQLADKEATTPSCKHPSITPETLKYALPQHHFSSPQQQLLAAAAQELHELRMGRGLRCLPNDNLHSRPSHHAAPSCATSTIKPSVGVLAKCCKGLAALAAAFNTQRTPPASSSIRDAPCSTAMFAVPSNPQQQASSVASLQRRLRQEVWSMSLPSDQYLLCRSPDGIDSPVRFSPVRFSATEAAANAQAQKRAQHRAQQEQLMAQRAASAQQELQETRAVLSRAVAVLRLERGKLSCASELCGSGSADGDTLVRVLQDSCDSLQRLVYAAQRHVQQLEAAAEAASASSVVACVAAMSEDSCEDEQDDDDTVDDASTASGAAAAIEMATGYQADVLQPQGPHEIECLSDDEQYCVQVQMGAQVAACAGMQRAGMTATHGHR